VKALAVELARGAGELLRKFYVTGATVTHKGVIDLVTDADRAAEEYIINGIRARYSDHGILAEESGGVDAPGEYRWIVDPLDGTVNFAHKIPHFSVLIAVQKRSANGFATEIGIVYDPMRDEMFIAEAGKGATLNGAAIKVSATATLIDSMAVTGFAYDRLLSKTDNHAEFCLMNLVTQGVRRFGSAGLDLAYTACGRFDLYWEYGLKPWDLAAGALLVTEAHGKLTNFKGETIDPAQGGSIIASNSLTHEAVIDALASAQEYQVNARAALVDHLPKELASELRALLNKQ
jgi:myo-inositol-1(or 4)-monophosphatase